jgi:restriction endonuclease EcoRV
VYRRIYTISVDTKIVSKVLELLLFPMFVKFAKTNGLKIDLCPQQNFYPDLTFTHEVSGRKFAVDIKSTYRTSDTEVNGMTLGAFTGYFRKRDSNKNTLFPYSQYSGHFVLGVIYSKCDDVADERKQFTLEDLPRFRPSSKTSISSRNRSIASPLPGPAAETRRTSAQSPGSRHWSTARGRSRRWAKKFTTITGCFI